MCLKHVKNKFPVLILKVTYRCYIPNKKFEIISGRLRVSLKNQILRTSFLSLNFKLPGGENRANVVILCNFNTSKVAAEDRTATKTKKEAEKSESAVSNN